MDRPGVHQVPEGSGEHRKMEETGCEVICGAPMTPAVKRYVKVKVNGCDPLKLYHDPMGFQEPSQMPSLTL